MGLVLSVLPWQCFLATSTWSIHLYIHTCCYYFVTEGVLMTIICVWMCALKPPRGAGVLWPMFAKISYICKNSTAWRLWFDNSQGYLHLLVESKLTIISTPIHNHNWSTALNRWFMFLGTPRCTVLPLPQHNNSTHLKLSRVQWPCLWKDCSAVRSL